MLGPLYNAIGNFLGEDRPVKQAAEEEVLEDPEEFCPGFLFDVSASWVLVACDRVYFYLNLIVYFYSWLDVY